MKTKILQNIFLSLGAIFALAITVHAQNLYVSVNGPRGLGNTDGSISEYTPSGMQMTFTSGIPRPRGLAFDSSGNLFAGVAYIIRSGDEHSKILKFPPLRHESVLGNAAHSVVEGVITDGAGNVFAIVQDLTSPVLAGIIYKFAPNGTRTIFGTTPGNSFDIAFDASGNLFAADFGDQTIYKFTPSGTRTVFAGPTNFADSTGPVGLAFDSSGNLFVSTEAFGDPGNDAILEFTPSGIESTFAMGLTMPRGLAFDASGNLFLAETLAAPDGDILEFTTGGAQIVFASGIDRPEFLAFGPAR